MWKRTQNKTKKKINNKKKHIHYFRSSSIPTHPLLSTKRETTMLSLQNQRQPKTTPLVDEYEISDTVLGLGINGKVVQCINRRTKQNFALKVLLDNEKARREVDLHWRVSGCKHIVNIIDVYENTYSGRKCLLVVMEWWVREKHLRDSRRTKTISVTKLESEATIPNSL